MTCQALNLICVCEKEKCNIVIIFHKGPPHLSLRLAVRMLRLLGKTGCFRKGPLPAAICQFLTQLHNWVILNSAGTPGNLDVNLKVRKF